MPARGASWLFLALVLVPSRPAPQAQADRAVRPAIVQQIKNLEIAVSDSYRAAYVPREWGRLVAVEKLDALNFVLFLQAENGDIFLVRLSQRGTELYLDTADRGGVVTVVPRVP